MRLGDPCLELKRTDCCPGEKPDEEFPYPAQLRMGYYLGEEFLVLKLPELAPEQPVQQELLVLPRLAPLELVLPAHLPPPSEPLEQGLVPQLRLGLQG